MVENTGCLILIKRAQWCIVLNMAVLDISVILTFHNEGVVAHKTFLALRRMLDRLDEEGISYEIIAHIDNGDLETKKYIRRARKKWELKVYENSFGEPSQSRNFAISKAGGKYVCLMDGDDLFSENWLLCAYRIQENSKDNVILHPECNMTFGLDEQPRLWRMTDSFDIETDTLILFGRNRWCSGTFLRRDLALRYPYKKSVGCYGFEDWHYNCETRANGVKHNIVPGSTLFYRVRKGSTYSKHVDGNTTIPYTDAFSLDRMRKIYKKEFDTDSMAVPDDNRALRVLRFGHRILRHVPILKLADKEITKRIESYRSERRMSELPRFLIKEWKEMNKIDSELYPDPEIVSRMLVYDSEVDYLGKIYCRLVHNLKKKPDYVFMPPIMDVGGTEKVLVNLLNAIYEIHPSWNIVIFGKLPKDHIYNIPKNVEFIDFDNITRDLSDWDRSFLITRFVVQMKVKRVHIIGNEFYFRWAVNNKKLIETNNIALNCSFFMHEFTSDENRILSFADSYLLDLEPYLNKIFTDNSVIADDLIHRTGIDPKKVSVHYQPIEFEMKGFIKPSKGGKHKILWASRVAPQKRPDILKRIAMKLPEGYEIDVYGRIQKPYFGNDYFKGAKNITYKGTFKQIDKIPVDDYDVYLYTAQTDGIPNILLEITALGLPIVATNEGGVSDFLEDGKNGRLIELNDIDGYVTALCGVIKSGDGGRYVKNAQKRLQLKHSWAQFIEIVKKDIR